MENTRASSLQVCRDHPAFPAQWFYGLFRALPGDRAFLPPSQAQCASIVAHLNASVGASGPHGFAVRELMLSSKHQSRPPHPAPNVRDDREPPLFSGTRRAQYASDLGFLKIRKFLREGLDRQLSDLPVGQRSQSELSPLRNSSPPGRGRSRRFRAMSILWYIAPHDETT